MTPRKKTVATLSSVCASMCASSAAAAAQVAVSTADPLDGVTVELVAALLILSTAMGVTSLLLRLYLLARNSRGDIDLKWLFIGSHMASAWAAGILAFVFARHIGMTFWEMVGAVLLASFAGAQFIEKLLNSRFGGILRASDESSTRSTTGDPQP